MPLPIQIANLSSSSKSHKKLQKQNQNLGLILRVLREELRQIRGSLQISIGFGGFGGGRNSTRITRTVDGIIVDFSFSF